MRIANRLDVRELTAPLRLGDGELILAPLQGQLADGTLGGRATVRFAAPARYAITSTSGTRGPSRCWPPSGAGT